MWASIEKNIEGGVESVRNGTKFWTGDRTYTPSPTLSCYPVHINPNPRIVSLPPPLFPQPLATAAIFLVTALHHWATTAAPLSLKTKSTTGYHDSEWLEELSPCLSLLLYRLESVHLSLLCLFLLMHCRRCHRFQRLMCLTPLLWSCMLPQGWLSWCVYFSFWNSCFCVCVCVANVVCWRDVYGPVLVGWKMKGPPWLFPPLLPFIATTNHPVRWLCVYYGLSVFLLWCDVVWIVLGRKIKENQPPPP